MQPPSDLHGIGYTARVMVWAAVLTRSTPWFESVVWREGGVGLLQKAARADKRVLVRGGIDVWLDLGVTAFAMRWVGQFRQLREGAEAVRLVAGIHRSLSEGRRGRKILACGARFHQSGSLCHRWRGLSLTCRRPDHRTPVLLVALTLRRELVREDANADTLAEPQLALRLFQFNHAFQRQTGVDARR
jgi:hypothetical protein